VNSEIGSFQHTTKFLTEAEQLVSLQLGKLYFTLDAGLDFT